MTSSYEAKEPPEDVWGQCLQRIAERDRQAFARLFDHFAPLVKAFGLTTAIDDRSGQFADELVQEVMITIWHKAATYDAAKASAATWIFTIARNKRIDLLRRLSRHTGLVDIDAIWPLAADDDISPPQLLQRHATEQRVRESLGRLPQAQREALTMAFIEGLSHSEIATALDMPLGTVKSRIRLAMARLQQLLKRWEAP